MWPLLLRSVRDRLLPVAVASWSVGLTILDINKTHILKHHTHREQIPSPLAKG